MQLWDNIYKNIKALLDHKWKSAQLFWSLSQTLDNSSLKINLLNIWRIENHHILGLNKLLQTLGYAQIKLLNKEPLNNVSDIYSIFQESISEREKWVPVLERITTETFGNEIYYTFMTILADDLVNIEVLKKMVNEWNSERVKE
ncbi:MAG: hypothetical protein ACOYJ1_04550 [Peptococcales bacterium]|jgi:hypothetical protein